MRRFVLAAVAAFALATSVSAAPYSSHHAIAHRCKVGKPCGHHCIPKHARCYR